MANQIIVLLDHSGSMASPFSGRKQNEGPRGLPASAAIKIEEAKLQLISSLETSNYDQAIVIPFSTHADSPIRIFLPGGMAIARSAILDIQAGGGTNLSSALSEAISIGSRTPSSTFLRYLIITDGLSSTPDDDLRIVQTIPSGQGIDGILIDPTDDGERHLRKLCLRGRYIPVYGSGQLGNELLNQEKYSSRRAALSEEYSTLLSKAQGLSRRMQAVVPYAMEDPNLEISIRERLVATNKNLRRVVERDRLFRERLAAPEFETNELRIEMENIAKACEEGTELVEQLSQYVPQLPSFNVSAAFPENVCKGRSSTFIVQVYPPHHSLLVKQRIASAIKRGPASEERVRSSLKRGMTVEIELSSSQIDFSKPTVKKLSDDGAYTIFWGKPQETCIPGFHSAVLSIRDPDSRIEHLSISLEICVVDFAFDHVSRPFVGNVVSAIVATGSVLVFTLGLLGKIDTGFGLASGTAGTAISAYLFHQMSRLYTQAQSKVVQPWFPDMKP
jgi:hypothetical protein